MDADVTRLEQEILDEHLEGFRALFDRAAIGMATLTVHATIVRANDALADLMSCEPSELVGVDYGRLTGGLGDVLDHRLEALRTSQENVATFEHRIPGPPGATDVRTALVTLVPIRDSVGQMLYVFAQVQDISAQRTVEDELHRTEEKFRFLVAAVEEYAVFMLDTRGRVMSWNAGARRIKGYRAHEIIGSDFRVFYPEEQQLTGHPQRNLEAALRDGSFAEEGWRVRQDGTRFWASVVISPVHDDRGLHIGFAKVTRDQTEQRQNADDRVEAMAEQARLLAVTAHELRNPTAVIDGSAHALQVSEGQMSAGERDQLFRGIRSSAERLRRLAADLTAASQLQGSGMEFRRQSVSLPELVRGAAARREAASPTAHVGVDVPDGAVLQADEVRLAQAIDNLLDNAIRHGAPPFTMGAQVRGDHVELRVTDAATAFLTSWSRGCSTGSPRPEPPAGPDWACTSCARSRGATAVRSSTSRRPTTARRRSSSGSPWPPRSPDGRPGHRTTAASITSGSETTEATEVTSVRVLSVPLVDRPSSDLNIQKKLLLTCRANIAPDAMARPTAMGEMVSESRIGAMMPAAVIAATDTEPIARCRTAAMNHASRMLSTTGAPSSAWNRSPSTLSSPVASMTAPSEPPTPVMRRISPVVWNPSSIASLVCSRPDEARERK